MTQRAADCEDRHVVARRLFEALCAHYPDKYIALIQPRDVANEERAIATGSRPRRRTST
jgi:hypothetical protein